ncbi:substrate-binding and VWA domain-containing protein [Haloechinothrix halophila]|uniref:substrate-binding and VWA domain-containing protein n=1 Tax=Haloechinothrix halophila TaxID=1069073 RepID=UPI000558247C|nr:substrate-binding and VWA domain-containing protein [Haloechinothrix halophila]
MGRHASAGPPRARVIVLSTLLVLTLVGWFAFDFLVDELRAAGCGSDTAITVTAATDIAPVVQRAARTVSQQEGDDCYRVHVTARDSEVTAESLVLSQGRKPPDVWIPESTMWLQHANDKGAWDVPVNGTSIASTPVVLALTEDAATQLGWPAVPPRWSALVGPDAGDFDVGIADPAWDPASLSALIALKHLASDAPRSGKAYTSSLRHVSANVAEEPSTLYRRLPGSSGDTEPLDAFPTTEFDLLTHNLEARTADLVASYPERPIPALDFPYIVLPDTTGERRDAAKDFLDLLVSDRFAEAFADAGFRSPEGTALRNRGKRTSAQAVPPVALPDAGEVRQLLNEWAGVNLSARIQVLLDVSGSMSAAVPGTGQTRMAATIEAAELGLRLFKPTTKIGLWAFSTYLDGSKPYRELLPVRQVREHLNGNGIERLRSAANQIGGNTGLYDSTLAAYRDATENWEAGRINIVVVLTDGKNAYPEGITREQLLAKLDKLHDPRRPLQVIGIGIGPDVDKKELEQIAAATGGEAFTTPDPSKIKDVFYAALSKLLCQPPACKPDSGR